MSDDPNGVPAILGQLLLVASTPFWKQPDFWIGQLVGLAGLVFSFLGYREAQRAKRAATAAGRTVKLQTVTIELSEISQKLEKIQPEIRFDEARDLLSESSRRLRRAVSPFAKDSTLGPVIAQALS